MVSFKRSESFYLREGWLSKGLHAIHENPKINVFSKENGIRLLGIGSNMVSGLRYWMKAAKLLDLKGKETEFGRLVFEKDPYVESYFTLFLIHYSFATNYDDCPYFYYVFTQGEKSFTKDTLINDLSQYVMKRDAKDSLPLKAVEDDFFTFEKTYINKNDETNPEDNLYCPLTRLKLLREERDHYFKQQPSFSDLSPLVVFYAIENSIDPFTQVMIDDYLHAEGNAANIFCLSRVRFNQYLDQLQNRKLVTVTRTAGLNVFRYEKKLSLPELFDKEFAKNV